MTTQKCAPGNIQAELVVPFLAFVPSSQVPDNSAHGSRHLQYTRTFLDIFTLVRCSLRGVVAAGKFVTVPWSRQNCRCCLISSWTKVSRCGSLPAHRASAKATANRAQLVICPILVLHVNVAKGKLWTPASKHSSNLPFEGAAEGCWQAVKYFNDVWWAQDVWYTHPVVLGNMHGLTICMDKVYIRCWISTSGSYWVLKCPADHSVPDAAASGEC